jgi:PAS domain S-box-containing protein
MTNEPVPSPLSDLRRYQLLVESVVDYAIFMLDAQGRVTSWNPGAERAKGYREDEIIGQHFSRFYTDEDRAAGLPAKALATAEKEGRFEHIGWRVRKDGTRFWAHVIIDPIRHPDGKIIGYAKVTRDLSEKHRAAETLSESEERFRILVQGVTDYAIYMLDPEGNVTSWNAGAQRFKGYTADEIIGKHFSTFYTDEDRTAGIPETALATAERTGRFETDGWRVRKDGTRFWANVVIDAIRNPSGTLIGFAKITRDLTERKLAEETLRRGEEQFRLLVQGVTDYAIYMLDPEGRVANWNMGAERIKGYKADEIVGQHFSSFYTPEEQAAGIPAQALETALREGKFERESQRVRKDGTRFWAHVVIDPIYDSRGKHIGFAKITRDVTARRQAEEALTETRAKLLQSQKLEAVGQLTGGIAHDFNNLLTAVLGSLELVRKRVPDDPRITKLIDNAVAGAQRGASLTQRLLAFARRQELHSETLDLLELIRGLTELIESSTGSAIEIQTHFPLRLSPAIADPNQLELAILNLVLNARDAMPNGGTITLSAKGATLAASNQLGLSAGDYVCLAVTDTGEGMDAETLARATEPFFTTKGVGRGSGLGLSMVHGVAEQSGGRLLLKSEKGRGTTAELWLRASAEMPQPAEPKQSHERLVAQTSSLTILVVDDDQLVLRNTSAMLEDLGHKPIEAITGAQALRILRKPTSVDLVLTDQIMPGITGLHLIAQIRSEWPEVGVMLASGYAEFPEGVKVDVPRLAKPFDQATLAKAIAQYLAKRTLVPFSPRRSP